MLQDLCTSQYPNMIEEGTEQPSLTEAVLSRSLDWRPLRVFLNHCIPVFLFECHPPCLAKIRATHSLWKLAFVPPLSSSLHSSDWLISDQGTSPQVSWVFFVLLITRQWPSHFLPAQASSLCYFISWLELGNKEYYLIWIHSLTVTQTIVWLLRRRWPMEFVKTGLLWYNSLHT